MAKLPKRPTKPYKPSPPKKEFTEKALIHTACCPNDSFTLEYLLTLIPKGIEPKDVTFTMSTEDDYDGFYSQLSVYATVTTQNEQYEEQLKEHKKRLKEYCAKYDKYKVAKEKYDRVMDEENLKRLEKQLEYAKKKMSRK